jgi:hypothetical protein
MNVAAMRFVPALLLVACSAEGTDIGTVNPPHETVRPAPIDPVAGTQAFTLGVPAWGMSRAPGGNLWFLSPSVGLIETTAAGAEVSRIAWGERGLYDYGFTDLAVLDDGSFALTANQEAWRYRPNAQVIESYFCFVPESDPIVQENQAIAYDRDSGLLHVAPARWDSSTGVNQLMSIRLETYTAADAAWQTAHDVTATGIVARGMAWDVSATCLWIASGDELHRFSREGVLETTIALDGISDAQGVLVDGDQLVVLDGATGAVHLVPRPSYF